VEISKRHSDTDVLLQSFPRGGKGVAHEYRGERKANAFVEWVGQEVPNKVEAVGKPAELTKWTKRVGPAVLRIYACASHPLQSEPLPRLLLLNSQSKLPLLWRVLSNRFKDKASFSVTRSKEKIPDLTLALNVSVQVEEKSKVLYWAPGESEPKVYEGGYKLFYRILFPY